MTRRHFYREAIVENVRAVEGEDRTYEFTVATEAPVNVGYGVPEILRMSGCKLARYRKNPVVIDTHTHGIKSILGKSAPRIENKRFLAKITLDETEEGEAAKKRIDSGSLRTCSVGYFVNWKKARELREGEVDGDVTGPAIVQREWTPFEITLCPVPADEDAVRRRSFEANTGRGRRKKPMKKMSYAGLPAPADDADETDEEIDAEEGEVQERQAPAPAPKPRPVAKPAPVTLLPSERAARDCEALKRQVMAFTPKGLEAVAERALLEGQDAEEVRATLLKAHAKRSKPLGTPEPIEEPEQKPAETKNPGAEALTADAVLRAITGARS